MLDKAMEKKKEKGSERGEEGKREEVKKEKRHTALESLGRERSGSIGNIGELLGRGKRKKDEQKREKKRRKWTSKE